MAATAQGQESGQEKDPFYPTSVQRPAALLKQPDADWGKDPFTNPFSGKTVATQQDQTARGRVKNLTGIIYSKDVRLAIFGGETAREGSIMGEQKLIAIRKRSVVLESRAGVMEEIFLDDFSIRK